MRVSLENRLTLTFTKHALRVPNMWHSGVFIGSPKGVSGLLNGSLGLSVTVELKSGVFSEVRNGKPRPSDPKYTQFGCCTGLPWLLQWWRLLMRRSGPSAVGERRNGEEAGEDRLFRAAAGSGGASGSGLEVTTYVLLWR